MDNNKEKWTVLCVDDDSDVVESLHDVFMDDYRVKTATRVQDALKILDTEDVFLVISDQRMPEMTGTEFLSKVNEIKPGCKKILLTGYADINASVDAINKCGVDKYFEKPWDDDELLETVNHLASLHKMDRLMDSMLREGKALKENVNRNRGMRNLMKDFLDNFPYGVCVTDEQEKIAYLNTKAGEILRPVDTSRLENRNYREIFNIKGTPPGETARKEDSGPEWFLESGFSDSEEGGRIQFRVRRITEKDKSGDRIHGLIFHSID